MTSSAMSLSPVCPSAPRPNRIRSRIFEGEALERHDLKRLLHRAEIRAENAEFREDDSARRITILQAILSNVRDAHRQMHRENVALREELLEFRILARDQEQAAIDLREYQAHTRLLDALVHHGNRGEEGAVLDDTLDVE